ncbi:Lacal_2735 family protein [Nonlabens dokdonensis]|nr:Lacal_2735 family protein [Nonlabens dokdonensis]
MQKEIESYNVEKMQLERLEKRYCSLMKQSFEIAIKNRDRSDILSNKALEIKKDIDHLRLKIYSD